MKGIRKGTPGVRESAKVKPVGSKSIKAILPVVPPVIAAMIRFQYHTGCRPEEVCRLRRGQIRRRGKVWVHVPPEHKTDHHDIERRIYIGPRAQRVLHPWLDAPPEALIFSPGQAEARRNAERRKARKTPMTPSQAKRRPKEDRKRPPATATRRPAIDVRSTGPASWPRSRSGRPTSSATPPPPGSGRSMGSRWPGSFSATPRS